MVTLYSRLPRRTLFSVREREVKEINSTEKIIWLLNRLGEPPNEMGLTELSKEMGFSKSGVYKILSKLVEEGFVVQNISNKKYTLGPALLRLGSIYTEQKRIYDLSQPIMKAISDMTKETVSIGIREGNDAILAYKIESPKAIRLYRKIGVKFPMYAGAIGKLLAAYHDPEIVNQLLESKDLKKITSTTITDPKKILLEYEKIRSNGYAHSNGEGSAGTFGISAPIFDKDGNVWSCLCIAGPREDFTDRKIKSWTQILVNGALEISYKLGY